MTTRLLPGEYYAIAWQEGVGDGLLRFRVPDDSGPSPVTVDVPMRAFQIVRGRVISGAVREVFQVTSTPHAIATKFIERVLAGYSARPVFTDDKGQFCLRVSESCTRHRVSALTSSTPRRGASIDVEASESDLELRIRH